MVDEWEAIQPVAEALKAGKHQQVIVHGPKVLRHCQSSDAKATLLGILASAHQSKENWDKSISYATEALKLDRSMHWVRLCRAMSLTRRGDLRLGLAEANRILEKETEYALGYYCRSVCFFLIANEEKPKLKPVMLRRSLADIDHALLLDPEDAEYNAQKKRLQSVVGSGIVRAEQSIDGWEIAGKLANVVGKFVGGMLG